MGRKTKHNKLTSPELLAKVNPENLRLRDDFLNYLRSTQKSDGTIYQYQQDINIFLCWNLEHNNNKVFVDLKKRDVVAFQSWCIYTNGNSPARVRRIKATLSSWSNAIEAVMDDEYEDFRPIIRKVESPINAPVLDKTVLSDEQIQLLLDTLTETGFYDQACFVALAANSGRRKSELVRFKHEWFTPDNIVFGSLYRTPEKVQTKGRAGGKYLTCYTLATNFQPYFDRYMQWRNENGVDSQWLFYDKKNPSEQLSTGTVDSWCNKFSRILGVDVYIHSFRHAFTTRLKSAGIPDTVIQKIIGWSSVDMVAIYYDGNDEDEIGMYFGDGGIKTDIKQTQLSDL